MQKAEAGSVDKSAGNAGEQPAGSRAALPASYRLVFQVYSRPLFRRGRPRPVEKYVIARSLYEALAVAKFTGAYAFRGRRWVLESCELIGVR